MEWITTLISSIDRYLKFRDDTTVDRLHRIYTVALITAFIPLITAQKYIVGKRIVCWTPAEFSSAHNTYADDICMLGQTNYFVLENITNLDNPSKPRHYPFLLYPWLPLILIFMACSFLLPYVIIWHGMMSRSDLNVKNLFTINEREKLANAIDFILSERYLKRNSRGFSIISIYLTTKLFYIFITIGHILLVHKILFGNYHRVNWNEIQQSFSVKYDIWSSAHLPIEVMCDFMIRMLGKNHNWYTIQCLLPFNMFSKRIFTFLTIWFYIIFIVNMIDLFYNWFWLKLWSSFHRYEYINQFFDLYLIHSKEDIFNHALSNQKLRDDFIGRYLMIDGYLLMKLVHGKASDVTMSRLTALLFECYLRHRNIQRRRIIIERDGVTI